MPSLASSSSSLTSFFSVSYPDLHISNGSVRPDQANDRMTPVFHLVRYRYVGALIDGNRSTEPWLSLPLRVAAPDLFH